MPILLLRIRGEKVVLPESVSQFEFEVQRCLSEYPQGSVGGGNASAMP